MSDNILLNLLYIHAQLRVMHFQTKSFARHKAFDWAYEEMDAYIDKFVETFQGRYGRMTLNEEPMDLKNIQSIKMDDFFKYAIDYLEGMSSKFRDTDTDLANIRDEMLSTMNKLKYLLSLK